MYYLFIYPSLCYAIVTKILLFKSVSLSSHVDVYLTMETLGLLPVARRQQWTDRFWVGAYARLPPLSAGKEETMAEVSDYERLRLEKIKANQLFLASLGLYSCSPFVVFAAPKGVLSTVPGACLCK